MLDDRKTVTPDLIEELAKLGVRGHPFDAEDPALLARRFALGDAHAVALDAEVFGSERQHTRGHSIAARCAECGFVTWLVKPKHDGRGNVTGTYTRLPAHAPNCSRPPGRLDREHGA